MVYAVASPVLRSLPDFPLPFFDVCYLQVSGPIHATTHSFYKAFEYLLWDSSVLGVESTAMGEEGLCWKEAYMLAHELGSEGHHSHVAMPPSHPQRPRVEGEQESGRSDVLTIRLGQSFQAALNISWEPLPTASKST